MSSALVDDPSACDSRSAYAVQRQEDIYDRASRLIWREAVYERLHGGWELANLGGLPFLDAVARLGALGPQSSVLELGSGSGAACEYLAQATGCRAMGVERNRAQHDLALARADGPVGERLRFVLGDVASWSPDEDFDAAFMLDTMSLLPDAAAALRTAATALGEDGRLFLGDLGAGPELDAAVLERAFVEDGFCSLLSVDETVDLLRRTGFDHVRLYERSEQARRNLRSIMAWLDDPPATALAVAPPEDLDEWRTVNRFYLEALESGALAYRWWSAAPLRRRTTP